MANALIDNATLHAAARLFQKPEEGLRAREINVQSLDSFLEAYILNESLVVDERFWQFFMASLPEVNRRQFSTVVQSTQLDLNPVIGLDEFLESEMVYFLLNMFNSAFREMDFYTDFLSYTGADFGNYANADGVYEGDTRHHIHRQVEKKLNEYWNWPIYTANMDHIDTAIMSYRTVNYITLAEQKGMNLVTHEIRNFFISEIGYAYELKIPQASNFKIYKAIATHVKNINEQHYVQQVLADKQNGKFVWDTIDIPFLPALIYEKADTVAEVFFRAEDMRRKFKPFRQMVNDLESSFASDQLINADKIQAELNGFFSSMEQQFQERKTEWSFSVGFPLSLSIGLARNERVPRYLKIFKHFLYRYSLPESYVRSCNRLFGPIRWNRGVKQWEI